MASNATTSDQPERESTSTSQGSAPSPHASVNTSSRCLFSSCFDWVFSFIPWRSVQSNSITASSTTDLIPENRVMDAFEGITSSASISTSNRIPESKVMGALEGIVPSASTSTTGLTSGSGSEVMGASTSTTSLISRSESEVVGASISATGTIPESEREVMGAFEGIMPSASTSTTERIPENEGMGAFEEIAPPLSIFASTLSKKPCYDVFINHRGPDVKHTLASSIYNILDNMGVTAFLDSEELEYGGFLPTTLQAAMRSALLHIAIFSPNYARSAWCLAELSFMLKTGAKILPVFYHVNPTDLRWVAQGKGVYVDAFLQYENKLRYSPEKLEEWKKALHDVSFYTGGIIDNNEYLNILCDHRVGTFSSDTALGYFGQRPAGARRTCRKEPINGGIRSAQAQIFACIYERNSRLYPPGRILIPHESMEARTVGGYLVPLGTQLLVTVWAIHGDTVVSSTPRNLILNVFSTVAKRLIRTGKTLNLFRCVQGEGHVSNDGQSNCSNQQLRKLLLSAL